MKSKFLILMVITIVCIAFVPFLAFAGSVIIPVDPPPAEAPFDGGLSLLIAAGIGYASKKAYDKRKKNKLQSDIDK